MADVRREGMVGKKVESSKIMKRSWRQLWAEATMDALYFYKNPPNKKVHHQFHTLIFLFPNITRLATFIVNISIIVFVNLLINGQTPEKREKPIMVVDMKGAVIEIPKTVVDKKKYLFQISTSQGKVYLIQAQSDADVQGWVDALRDDSSGRKNDDVSGGDDLR
jgi:hypothetical protein